MNTCDLKETSKKLGGLGAMLICVPVILRIYKGDRFSATSFFLWSALSLVSGIVLIRAQRGGATMLIGYVLSDLAIAIYAYRADKNLQFGHFEIFILELICACVALYLWCESQRNLRPAVLANAAAILAAGVPQFVDSFRHPHEANFAVYGGYMVVSALSLYGEKPTLEGRLIPTISIIYWSIIILGVSLLRLVHTAL